MSTRISRRGFTQAGTLGLVAACLPQVAFAKRAPGLVIETRFVVESYDEESDYLVVGMYLTQHQRANVELVTHALDLIGKKGSKSHKLDSGSDFLRRSRRGLHRRTLILPKGEEVRYGRFSGIIKEKGKYTLSSSLKVSAKDYPRSKQALMKLKHLKGLVEVS